MTTSELGTDPPLIEMGWAFAAWLAAQHEALARFREPEPEDYGARAARVRDLQRILFDSGWARYGWPLTHGGLGGTVLHRAALIDRLARDGYPPRHLLEHLEILPPALIKYARPALLDRLLLPTLRGDVVWCQGFSEPSAGSDLAALRTRAERADGGFRIHGHKIWTSWAAWADHCLVLARTGATEARHRAISAFVVALDAPGLTVAPIRQANGTEELAEVFFDGVFVPEDQLVGELDGGWSVAMEILAGERGSYGWLRHTYLLGRIEALAALPEAVGHERALGERLAHLLALRCRSREVMEILAAGEQPGPESSVSKVLVIDGENALLETAREVLSPALDLGTLAESWQWQEGYLYSRASGIYGGTRQIQLNVIGKLLVRSGRSARRHAADAELDVVRDSVRDAAARSAPRAALEGLDWWGLAARPADALGRAAFAAWFEEQGRILAVSPALAGVAGSAAAVALGVDAADLAFGVGSVGEDGAGTEPLLIGFDSDTKWLVFAGEDDALVAAPADAAEIAPWAALDRGLVVRARVPRAALRGIEVPAAALAGALALARIGAAFEILGASSALTDRVVDHTNQREQFGQPLSGFQAVQHMIADVQVDVAAMASLADAALEAWSADRATPAADAAKALAGRAGRRVAQRTLQCFGAIAFTDEHDHHRYLRRITTLDALLGSTALLERGLGAALIRDGRAPRCVEAWRPESGGDGP